MSPIFIKSKKPFTNSTVSKIVFALALFLGLTGHSQTVLTQTVGTSAFQVVTSREVKASELIGRALEKEINEPLIELSQDSASRALVEVAIFRESQTLQAIKLQPEEISSLVEVVKGRLQKSGEWKKLDISDEELKNWVERKKIATEFLKLKANSMATIVTDQEIQEYYEKNRVKFGSTPLADQRNNIRLFLQKESQKQRVQEWVSALKTKYQIRNDLADIGVEISNGKVLDKTENKSEK